MALTVATWNVNSLRVRLQLLLAFLDRYQPDILALQETKVADTEFPLKALQESGFYCIYKGQKGYNGVALLSRLPLKFIRASLPAYIDPQCRVLSACLGEVKIVNIYVPNGAQVDSDKYQYKLQWFAALQAYLHTALQQYPKLIVLGDFNIAPFDKDVYDPEACAGQVLVSKPERVHFQKLLDLGLQDIFRLMNPEAKAYTWWDYRQGAFHRGQGLRIDHILVSESLSSSCIRCEVDMYWRKQKRPSDHAPVIAYFN